MKINSENARKGYFFALVSGFNVTKKGKWDTGQDLLPGKDTVQAIDYLSNGHYLAGLNATAGAAMSFIPGAGLLKPWSKGLASVATSSRTAQLATNRAVGKAAEAQAAKDLVAEGNMILGSLVSVRIPLGRRVIDHLVQTPGGVIQAVEVKAGNAVRNAAQMAKDNAMGTQGGVLVGKNAPATLKGQNIIIKTVERRY